MKFINKHYNFTHAHKNTKIGYKVYGNDSKQVFIFFNGLMRSDYIFYPIIKNLGDAYKIYTFDYPGGLSSPYMEGVIYNANFYLNLVNTFISEIDLPETATIHMVGYSFGCSVLANYLSYTTKKQFKRISFICPTGFMPDRTLFDKSTILIPGLTRILFNLFKSNKKIFGKKKIVIDNINQMNSLDSQEKQEFIDNYLNERENQELIKRIINTIRAKWFYQNSKLYKKVLTTYKNKVKFLFALGDESIGEYDRERLKKLIKDLEFNKDLYIKTTQGEHNIIYSDVDRIHTFLI